MMHFTFTLKLPSGSTIVGHYEAANPRSDAPIRYEGPITELPAEEQELLHLPQSFDGARGLFQALAHKTGGELNEENEGNFDFIELDRITRE